MAPGFSYQHNMFQPTLTGTCSNQSNSPYVIYGRVSRYDSSLGSYNKQHGIPEKKRETKKEKIARISKERMLASWKMHDEKTPTIIKVIRPCNPKHQINHLKK